MNRHPVLLLCLVQLLSLTLLSGQNKSSTSTGNSSNSGTSDSSSAGAEVVSGPRGFLSIDYKGGRFVVPFHKIVSMARHEYLIDGGGMVHELTIDTEGTVIARYYYLESPLENNPLNAAQVVNNRLKKVRDLVEERTGQSTDVVIKHYPETTHAKTVEYRVSNLDQLERIYQHVYDDWVEHNGKGDGHTLKIR